MRYEPRQLIALKEDCQRRLHGLSCTSATLLLRNALAVLGRRFLTRAAALIARH